MVIWRSRDYRLKLSDPTLFVIWKCYPTPLGEHNFLWVHSWDIWYTFPEYHQLHTKTSLCKIHFTSMGPSGNVWIYPWGHGVFWRSIQFKHAVWPVLVFFLLWRRDDIRNVLFLQWDFPYRWGGFNTNMQSDQCKVFFYCGDETILGTSYSFNGISHTREACLYWIRTLEVIDLARFGHENRGSHWQQNDMPVRPILNFASLLVRWLKANKVMCVIWDMTY